MSNINGLVIGVDFDNTLAIYDDIIYRLARLRGLSDNESSDRLSRGKKEIRDHIRLLPDGEIEWQKLQAAIYGPFIGMAKPSPGFSEFLSVCSRERASVYVISHKTKYAHYDETGTDLRKAALQWMNDQGFINGSLGTIDISHIFFEPTRQQKINRIQELGCSYFVDDLEETFLEESFPESTAKILYSPEWNYESCGGINLIGGWADIARYIFPDV